MAKDKYYGKTLRKNFARHEEVMAMPNLLEIQKRSYKWFLETGLREVFADVASITDYAGNLELSFIDYSMDEKPKYDVEECKARDATYAAPLKVNVRLYNNQTQEIKEQEIFMGDFPLMTNGGTFVINGAERVVVSQIVRSPGVYYGKEIDLKTDLPLLTSTVIPYRGAWLEYETDTSEVFWVRIDKNRKLPVTVLCRALGRSSNEDILNYFGEDERILATLEKEMAELRDSFNSKKAQWENEKNAVNKVQSLRAEVESTKAEIEKATRTGDYAKAGELQYGKLPTLQKQLEEEEKLAVQTGYWPLYRFNPELAKEGKNPFQLDYTKDPNGELQAFLAGETRFAALDKKDPEVSKQLKAELDKAYNERHALYKQLASLPHPGSEN